MALEIKELLMDDELLNLSGPVRGRPFEKGRSVTPPAGGVARATGRRSPPRCCSTARPRR
jgi:hypothetical protein